MDRPILSMAALWWHCSQRGGLTDGNNMRPCDYFARSASLYPERIATKDATRSFSYAEALAFVEKVAGGLASRLGKGGHVAVYSPNDCRVPLIQMAINAAGLAWISMHPGNSPEANADLLKRLDCELVIVHPYFLEVIDKLVAANPGIAVIAMDSESSGLDSLEQFGCDPLLIAGTTEFSPWDTAMLQPTGGTTGEPKGVIHTNASIEASILAFGHEDETLHGAKMLAIAPLTHGAGIWAIAGLAAGASIYVLTSFDVVALFEAVQADKITSVFLPPTALYALMDHQMVDSYDLSSLRNIMLGAAPISPTRFYAAVAKFGPILHEVFGQTETLAPITFKRPIDYLLPNGDIDHTVLSSVGRPVFNAWIEILTDDYAFAEVGEVGEIIVRSAMTMKGYYKNEAATAEADWRGWHRTGDIGRKDADGNVFIIDRKRDMIISGGFNIYPSQVEKVIASHPSVAQVVVIGVPDEKWGEAVKAVVEVKPGETFEEDEIIALCRSELGRVHAPKSIEVWADIPRSPVGKLLRKDVRKVFWKDRDHTI